MQSRLVALLLLIYFSVCLLVAFGFDGTLDSGDSIVHFLFSKWAFKHPDNFFDHWAKPVYVLFSAPFAQLGFVGIKIFNSLVAALTCWLAYSISVALNKKNAPAVIGLLIFAPSFTLTVFSGLTEQLFGLFLALGIFLAMKEKFNLSALVISFIPLVRSEGLIIAGVFLLYFLFKRKYKALPLLLAGQFIYAIAGAKFHRGDFLWVFSKIPYATLNSVYGSGDWLHFINQLLWVEGLPIYILLAAGLVLPLFMLILKKTPVKIGKDEATLVYGCFASFFIAHTVFWKFGIFNSMGLNRVFVGVMPVMAIISLNGLNHFEQMLKQVSLKFSRIVIRIIIMVCVAVYPFTGHRYAAQWEWQLNPKPDHQLAIETADYINKYYSGYVIYHAASLINLVMDIDPFDGQYSRKLFYWDSSVPDHSIIVWDNWFAPVDMGIPLEKVYADPRFIHVKTFKTYEGNREIVFELFEKVNSKKAVSRAECYGNFTKFC